MKSLKDVVWEGSSLEDLKKFPKDIVKEFGHEILRLQKNEAPFDSKSMGSIGSGVYELRQKDKNGWYRVIYYTKVKESVNILHSFTKKSTKTPKLDLELATKRLKNLKAREQEKKRKAKIMK